MRATGVRKAIKSAYFGGLSCPLRVGTVSASTRVIVASTIATQFVVGWRRWKK